MAEDFFAQETRMVRNAMVALCKQTRDRVYQATDIRPLIRHRPWASLLATFCGGMVSGYLITPRRKSSAERAAKKEAKRAGKAEHPHRRAADLFQEHLIGALTPTIGAFASAAAAALFHREAHGNAHPAAAPEELPVVNPMSEP